MVSNHNCSKHNLITFQYCIFFILYLNSGFHVERYTVDSGDRYTSRLRLDYYTRWQIRFECVLPLLLSKNQLVFGCLSAINERTSQWHHYTPSQLANCQMWHLPTKWTADRLNWKLHKHGSNLSWKINQNNYWKYKMNVCKVHFVARLPKCIGGATTICRNFTSDRGLWMNTVLKPIPNTHKCLGQTTEHRRDFQIWIKEKKEGYKTQKDVSTKQHVIDGFKMLKSEFKLWQNEVKEHFLNDPILVFRPGGFEPGACVTYMLIT